ncbi:hypothetical protein ACFL49_00640 [Candidatus Omnitrophota bacterium]
MKQVDLKNEMNALITRERWDLFITITFSRSVSSFNAKKRFKYFFKHVNTEDKMFFTKYVKTWVFFEKDGYRNGVHIHSLLSGISENEAVLLEIRCKEVFGQCKVLAYRPNERASYYLACKYPLGVLADYDFLKINSRLRIKKGQENEKSRNICTSKHKRSNISSTDRKA